MIGAGQSTYKNDFPVCSLPTAPGCNALAALRPLSLPHKGQGPATSMALRRLALFKKKCSGYQRLLAPAYRLSLARSEGRKS